MFNDKSILITGGSGSFGHAYPESVCNVYSVLGLARTHAPSALKNMESGS